MRRQTLTTDQLQQRLTAATMYDHADVLASVMAELQKYEERHGMTTAQMRKKVLTNELTETHDICGWLMVDNRRRALQ